MEIVPKLLQKIFRDAIIMKILRKQVIELSERKTDRRSLKTQKALCDALTELLIEKDLYRITVQEIADKADVNRVTFYKHYLDVFDLYEKIEKDVLTELGLLILRLEERSSEEFFSCLINYIDENRMLFRMIFSPNTTGQLRNKFDRLLSGLFLKMQSEKQDVPLGDRRLGFQNRYRTQGCIAVISKWVLGGFTDSKEFIVKTLSELDLNTERFINQYNYI